MTGDTNYHLDKCDVFSFGVVIWQVLTQKVPYDEEPFKSMSNRGTLCISLEFAWNQTMNMRYHDPLISVINRSMDNWLCSLEIEDFVISGKRLSIPVYVDDRMRNLISGCWNHVPSKRPDFGEIVRVLEDALRSTPFTKTVDAQTSARSFSDPMWNLATVGQPSTDKSIAKVMSPSSDNRVCIIMRHVVSRCSHHPECPQYIHHCIWTWWSDLLFRVPILELLLSHLLLQLPRSQSRLFFVRKIQQHMKMYHLDMQPLDQRILILKVLIWLLHHLLHLIRHHQLVNGSQCILIFD